MAIEYGMITGRIIKMKTRMAVFSVLIVLAVVFSGCTSTPAAQTGNASSAGSANAPARQTQVSVSNNLFDELDPIIEKTFYNLSQRLASGLRIALLPPGGSTDKDAADYIYDELYIKFINASSYRMVDRADIDKAIGEMEFGMTGLVSDETAARIGHLLGAQAIMFGEMTGSGNTRRLVFRALEVETGVMLGVSSERF